MKEAAGEANMTVITIVLIGVIAAIAIPMVSSLMKSTGYKACCTDAGGVWKSNKCQNASGASTYDSKTYKSCTASLAK